jgi:transposase-like protein
MPWKDTSPVNERVKFVAGFLEGNENFSELCDRFGISRKQGYKWRLRYETGGIEALKDRSRAALNHPRAVRRRLRSAPYPERLLRTKQGLVCGLQGTFSSRRRAM